MKEGLSVRRGLGLRNHQKDKYKREKGQWSVVPEKAEGVTSKAQWSKWI